MTLAEKEKRIADLAAHVKAGGAPFGPPVHATIGEVVAAYQRVIRDLQHQAQ